LPFLYLSYAGNGHLIGLADARTPLRIAVTANMLNVLLEWILVYGWHLGLRGSAWSRWRSCSTHWRCPRRCTSARSWDRATPEAPVWSPSWSRLAYPVQHIALTWPMTRITGIDSGEPGD